MEFECTPGSHSMLAVQASLEQVEATLTVASQMLSSLYQWPHVDRRRRTRGRDPAPPGDLF